MSLERKAVIIGHIVRGKESGKYRGVGGAGGVLRSLLETRRYTGRRVLGAGSSRSIKRSLRV
jgi:hypothetical protein